MEKLSPRPLGRCVCLHIARSYWGGGQLLLKDSIIRPGRFFPMKRAPPDHNEGCQGIDLRLTLRTPVPGDFASWR